MSEPSLTIGMLGRIPPGIGGAGLERQIARTAAALERRGHRTVAVDASDGPFDVLHAFSSEPSVWHHLAHWTRNPAPLVVTPVVVVSPGRAERVLRATARLPAPLTGARMRHEVIARADALVAGSEYERGLIEALGGDARRIAVIGNGADSTPAGELPGAAPRDGYALLLGAVSPRKRQAEILRALAGHAPVVVAGGWAGPDADRAEWERTLRETGATWLGEVGDPGAVAALQEHAAALVHLSSAEVQSLAVIEALGRGTPVVASDIPSHRELAARYPGLVRVVDGLGELPEALADLTSRSDRRPADVPSWDDVARELERVYRGVLLKA